MLTGFQLKAALGVLKIKVTELSKLIDIHRFTISKLAKTPNTQYLKCHSQTLVLLEKFFKENGILFLDNFSISLKIEKPITIKKGRLTIFQLRAARAALNLSFVQFSKLTSLSRATLCNLEQGSISDYVKNDFVDTEVLKQFFIKESLSFPNDFTVRVDE